MKLRHAAVVLLAASTFAGGLPELPRPIVANVSALDPALRSGSWSAWRAGDPSTLRPQAPAAASDSRFLVVTVLEPPAAATSWVLLAQADERAATVLARASEIPGPAQELLVPRPSATATPGRIDVAWSLAGAPGLAAWRLERSSDGVAWSELATLPPDATAASEGRASGAWTYRLVPVLLDGIEPAVAMPASAAVRGSDGDRDDDGVADGSDRCTLFPDASQQDSDADGVSDACDFAWADVAPTGAPDGSVGLADVVRILRFAVGLETPTSAEIRAADVAPAVVVPGTPATATPRAEGLAAIDVNDAVLALRASVGLARFAPPR